MVCHINIKQRLFLLSLFALLCACTGPTKTVELPSPGVRGHDPWVFRSVLDQRPRMITLALSKDLWAAYDTENASLYKVWRDGVTFDGAVYTTRHGPQPSTQGLGYVVEEPENPWRVNSNGREYTPDVDYLGHRFGDGHVYLHYRLKFASGGVVEIEEVPESVAGIGGAKYFRRFSIVKNPKKAEVSLTTNVQRQVAGVNVSTDGRWLLSGNEPAKVTTGAMSASKLRLNSTTTDVSILLADRPEAGATHVVSNSDSIESVMEQSDCASCHNADEKTVGPSYRQIAERYLLNGPNVKALAEKIINGGAGRWGDIPMAPHPSLAINDAMKMVAFILELDPEDSAGVDLGAKAEEGALVDLAPPAPGDDAPLQQVHPAFKLVTIRPEFFKPRVGGMDFLDDGRLVISTWSADGAVYVIEGTQHNSPSRVLVKKIASGLAEPLALKIVNRRIYVLQKQELTELIDHDGDELIDEYRVISNKWSVTDNFHEFAFGLLHKNGYFYATLATAVAPGGAPAKRQAPDRGQIIRISAKDGEVESIARGLRTPNGIGFGVDGEMFAVDVQGNWLPANKIVHMKEGKFFGFREVNPIEDMQLPETPPAVWLPQGEVAAAPSNPVPLNIERYRGQMLYGDVTYGGLQRVALEKVAGEYQGCVFPFSQGLEAGVNRSVWGPDGALYVGEIGNPGSWGQPGKLHYGLQKLVPTGQFAFEMLDIHPRKNGVLIEFTEPLAAGDGTDPEDYEIFQWRYLPTKEYGGPKVDEEQLIVRSVRLAPDRRSVFVELDGLKEKHVVRVRIARPFVSASNREMWSSRAWCTMNHVPESDSEQQGTMEPRNSLSDDERADGWRLLFDGVSTKGWRNYNKRSLGKEWAVQDGSLTLSRAGGGDIVYDENFSNFELKFEWKLQSGGNSGVFFNVVEGVYADVFETGPEMQLLDDVGHGDGRWPSHRAGAAYDIYPPRYSVTKPPGVFNTARLIVNNGRVEHWLNGHKIVEYDLWSEQWRSDVASSKFKGMPAYGTANRGYIALHDHGDRVWFRNIKIKPLDKAGH